MTNDMQLSENEKAIIEAIRAAAPQTVITVTKNGPHDRKEFRLETQTSAFLSREDDL